MGICCSLTVVSEGMTAPPRSTLRCLSNTFVKAKITHSKCTQQSILLFKKISGNTVVLKQKGDASTDAKKDGSLVPTTLDSRVETAVLSRRERNVTKNTELQLKQNASAIRKKTKEGYYRKHR